MRPRPHCTRPTANSSRFLSPLLLRYITASTPYVSTLVRDLTIPILELDFRRPLRVFASYSPHLPDALPRLVFRKMKLVHMKKYERGISFKHLGDVFLLDLNLSQAENYNQFYFKRRINTLLTYINTIFLH